jgi:hypothetical protein
MAKQVEDYIIYMDTDSIKTTTDCPIILDNSKELGRMKLEYTIEADGKIIGEPFYSCKHYGNIFTNPKLKGVKTSKMKYSNICPKGMLILDERDLINMRFNIIKIDESTGIMVFTFNKPYLWREAVRRGKKMALWESITKTLLVQDTKRVWYGEEFYGQGKKSYPIHYKGGDKLLENLAVQNVITVAKTNLKVSA